MKRLQEEIRENSVQTGFNETGMGLCGYIFEDKSNVPWSYVLTVWLRGVLNSFSLWKWYMR